MKGKNEGFVTCRDCHRDMLARDIYPSRSIANQYWFGSPPSELLALNEAELALLSPTHCWGYCFVYHGGAKLKGILSYFKIKPTEITKMVLVATKLVSKLSNKIVYIFVGQMTKKQRDEARRHCAIRTNLMIPAIKWLAINHPYWQALKSTKLKNN